MRKLIIYSAVIVTSLLIILYIATPPKPKQQMSQFGNILSSYFYYINTNTNQYTLTANNRKMAKHLEDKELNQFYQKFKWKLNQPLIDYYSSYIFSTWNSLEIDGVEKANFLKYWQTIRPQVRAFYDQSLPQYKVESPVIHFRCSDSPFNKHYQYHLTTSKSVNWMAQQLKARGYDKAIMLMCNKHFSLDQQNCNEYADFYTTVFAKHGITIDRQCNSILQDFSMMVYSPVLIALNTSSYSFMAGIAKPPQDFISCNMGVESNAKYYLQQQADWILDPRPPLLHAQVHDYHDSQAVIKQLSNS